MQGKGRSNGQSDDAPEANFAWLASCAKGWDPRLSADGTLFGFEQSQSPIFGFAYANGKYTTITDPHEVAITSLDGTEAVNANLEGVVVGDYTYTPGTGIQAGYLHGYIATP